MSDTLSPAFIEAAFEEIGRVGGELGFVWDEQAPELVLAMLMAYCAVSGE